MTSVRAQYEGFPKPNDATRSQAPSPPHAQSGRFPRRPLSLFKLITRTSAPGCKKQKGPTSLTHPRVKSGLLDASHRCRGYCAGGNSVIEIVTAASRNSFSPSMAVAASANAAAAAAARSAGARRNANSYLCPANALAPTVREPRKPHSNIAQSNLANVARFYPQFGFPANKRR